MRLIVQQISTFCKALPEQTVVKVKYNDRDLMVKTISFDMQTKQCTVELMNETREAKTKAES